MNHRDPATAPSPNRALEEAESVVDRVARDEAAARDERARLVDVRPATRAEQITPDGSHSVTGRLHLTTRRLVLVGAEPLEVDLSTIEELSLVGERLMIGLGHGRALSLEIAAPRTFRVRTAFAMAQAR